MGMAEVTTRRTYCRNCAAACGLLLETDGQQILSVQADREHPLTQGYMCVKGLMSADWRNGEDRLVTPMRRDGNGGFAAVPMPDALDAIADRLTKIVAEHGPKSVALYFGTGAKLNTLGTMALRSWLKQLGSPYLYSSSTVDQSAKWVTRGRMGAFRTGKHVILDTDMILLVGANPAVSHQGLPFAPFPSYNSVRWVQDAKKRGMKLVVIDPRRTEFARLADLHLPVIPGEDATLLAGMIHVILANGWEDKAFAARFTTSLDRLRASVAAFPPGYAAERSGVPVEDLIEAARLFATSACRTACSGTGPNMSIHSNLAEHLVECLNAICGAYRRAGDIVRNPGSFNRLTKMVEGVLPPSRSWEAEPKLWTRDSGAISGEYPASQLPGEILDGGIRALVVVGGNMVKALGQPEHTTAALARLDLLVTIDPRMTETAQLSDFVLPSTTPYERYDASHLFDMAFIRPFAQIATPIIAPPDGLIDDWEIFWELSRRMGIQLKLAEYKWGAGDMGSPELALDMVDKPAAIDLIQWLCDRGDASFDDLIAHPEGVVSAVPPIIIEAAVGDDGARIDLCPDDVAAELAAVRAIVPERGFDYRLVVRRSLETMNSAFRNSGRTRRRWPNNPAFMNPDDMAHEGIAEGARIAIASRHGRIWAEACADRGLRRGVLSMSHQWGALDPEEPDSGWRGAFTGRLVSLEHELETINYMPRQSGIPINISRVTG